MQRSSFPVFEALRPEIQEVRAGAGMMCLKGKQLAVTQRHWKSIPGDDPKTGARGNMKECTVPGCGSLCESHGVPGLQFTQPRNERLASVISGSSDSMKSPK